MSIDIIQRETVIIMDPRKDGETIITIGIGILTIVNGRKETHCVKDVSELGCDVYIFYIVVMLLNHCINTIHFQVE
jgi:hypothetical protein